MLINKAGGAAKAAGAELGPKVRAAFAAAHADVDIVPLDGCEMEPALRELVGQERRVVVAGGDGTISCAAGVLAETAVELAILPLGTLNHLARDAGIPADLDAAAALAAHGSARAIDTVRLGEHTFVNNASIGVYPDMVRSREALQERGWPKWIAAIPAAWVTLIGTRDLHLAIDTGSGPRRLATPLLFVGNNRYSLESGSVGQRTALDGGEMGLLAVRRRSKPALAWFALRAVFGKSDRQTDFEALTTCTGLKVEARHGRLDVGLDGEVQAMTTPLEFRLLPRSLRIVAPPDGADRAGAA